MALHAVPTRAPGGPFHVVVESPRGAAVKLRYDPGLDAFTLARPLVLGLTYPFDWGFVPGTRAPDGDPLDALVLWDGASFPGVVLACRALGVVRVEQNGKGGGRVRNDRVIATPVDAPREQDPAAALRPRVREELERFFQAATFLEGKDPRVLGWEGPGAAEALVDASRAPGA